VLRRLSAPALGRLWNFWPPFAGAGIRVREISRDWRYARVELIACAMNRGYFGTHFGGSLFAMTDPFYTVMLARLLGGNYLVWDQAAEIEYVKPGQGTVRAEFRIDEACVAELRRVAENGDAVRPEFLVKVTDESGAEIARVRKRLYVRLKKRLRPVPRAASPTAPEQKL
jgi:acyl-coenzyme A thioesterase PaaI-like protein